MSDVAEKEAALRHVLSSLGSVVVAYSGGVDRAYLDAFGEGELRPVKAAPPPPSSHPLAALFAR